MASFTVDTHLFRELGELLVGRDSTALVELIKNAYDADATQVTVHGERLDDPDHGRIIISDNGVGMTPDQFTRGFLRIASRIKEEGDRRSPRYNRRFTGVKGVGRLAAHKLARRMVVYAIPDPKFAGATSKAVSACIDWDIVESKETLDDLVNTKAIVLSPEARPGRGGSGTTIELQRLRRKWTPGERARFFWEVQTFQPPAVLLNLPSHTVDQSLLFDPPRFADTRRKDPGFALELTGDFESGEEYWQTLVQAADWVIDIDADKKDKQVHYLVTPTCKYQRETKGAEQRDYSIPHPSCGDGPFFQARILVREGTGRFKRAQRPWVGRASGIRVYMEGFRVLPYGEPTDDWLSIDADYAKRAPALRFLDEFDLSDDEVEDSDRALVFLRKDAYFGAVFLTQSRAPALRMLVNREGFVPDAALDALHHVVRAGIDLSVRVRAAASKDKRAARRETRRPKDKEATATAPARLQLKKAVESSVQEATRLASEAQQMAAGGKLDKAQQLIARAAAHFSESAEIHDRLMTERSIMQILAAVGLQMAAFVHEINGLLGLANSLENAVDNIRKTAGLGNEARKILGRLRSSIGDLRRVVERQASYLTDITSPDARRRRSRQKLADRFDSGARIVRPAAERRGIEIINDIPMDLKTPPMFPAEITLVFSNLLTNAVKAAGKNGRIRATAEKSSNGQIVIRIENTGRRIDLASADRYFRAFESTTIEVDPVLGQGMGMGLPITRNMLEEYGAEIRFITPSPEFATAVEIVFT